MWPYDGSTLTLNYTYGGAHRYLGNVVQGATNWTQAGTKVRIREWPGIPYAMQLPLVDVNEKDTYWAMTVFPGDCYSCAYGQTSIWFNRHTLDTESDAQRTKVATHEFGHALGLTHPNERIVSPFFPVDSSTPSLMWQGLLNASVRQTPQAIDTARVNGMYP